MKKVLSVMAIAAMLMFSACTRTSETPITDVLKSAKKGWVMTSVVSNPA
jgi:protein involved in sex pheromone biosynthesis